MCLCLVCVLCVSWVCLVCVLGVSWVCLCLSCVLGESRASLIDL
jgi:hypothetical protein